MKGNILNKLLIICCLLAMVSCKARKLAVNSKTTVKHTTRPVNNSAVKLIPIRESQISFNTFSAKAHTQLNINGSSNDVTLNIRVSNNQKIWVSVTALLGIEIARALITPDSIQIINRLQGVYIKKPFSYIYTFTNRQVNYAMLQALLIGNAIPAMLNDSTNYHAVNDSITLSGNLQDLIYKLIIGHDMKVTQTSLSNQDAGQSLQINNNLFIKSGNNTVPSQIDIASMAKDKKIQVNLRYVKVDFNLQQEYPFNIPDSYSPSN
jgi:hypothetical protein